MMTDMIFHQPGMLWLMLLVPVLVGVFRYRVLRQRRDTERFGVVGGARWLGQKSVYVSLEPYRLMLLVAATMMMIAALTRPAVNPHPKMIPRDGRDVVFLLDVSKSMLAEDRLPNRLESAKASIAECVQSLQDHRVGLVVFAGSSSIVCPLTMDKNFFLNSLEKVGPESVAHGGTRMGDALLKVCDKLFSDDDSGYKDIVLISDGGEQSEGVSNAIKEINDKQVRLIALGVGDANQGARIPVKTGESGFMKYQNAEVWSRLDSDQLSGLVKSCDLGAYLPVGTRQMQLASIYHRLSQEGGTQQLAEESVISYDEIFHYFIALSLLFLVMMIGVPHTRRRQLRSDDGSVPPCKTVPTVPAKMRLLISAMLFLFQLAESPQLQAGVSSDENDVSPPRQHETTAKAEYMKGNQHYRAAEWAKAMRSYESALKLDPAANLVRNLNYNLANAYYQASAEAQSSYESLSLVNRSLVIYRHVLLKNPDDQDAAVNNELARVARKKWLLTIEKEERRRQEMQLVIDQIREQLVSLITQQQNNLPEADETSDRPSTEGMADWVKAEKIIAKGTEHVSSVIRGFNLKFFAEVPVEFTPLAETYEQVSMAWGYQKEALNLVQTQWSEAQSKGLSSLNALRLALAALPQDAETEGEGEGNSEANASDEGEEGNSEEEGDGDSEGQGEDDGGNQGGAESMASGKIDLESIQLPPPNNSPDDVIQSSQALQEARKSSGGNKQSKPVERDW